MPSHAVRRTTRGTTAASAPVPRRSPRARRTRPLPRVRWNLPSPSVGCPRRAPTTRRRKHAFLQSSPSSSAPRPRAPRVGERCTPRLRRAAPSHTRQHQPPATVMASLGHSRPPPRQRVWPVATTNTNRGPRQFTRPVVFCLGSATHGHRDTHTDARAGLALSHHVSTAHPRPLLQSSTASTNK